MIRSLTCAIALALLGACTSAELRGAYSVAFRANAPTSHDVLPYPLDAVWSVVPLAFADLGLPGGAPMNREALEYMTPQLRIRNQLYGRRNSEFVECGYAEGGRSIEDQAELRIALITRLEEVAPGRTAVRTQLDAYAKRRDVSGDFVPCNSRGFLERALVETIQERLRSGDRRPPA